MSYEKQNFKTGQVLTAPHLNHMEDGISKAVQAYKEQSEVVVFAEQTMAFTDGRTEDFDYEDFSGVVEGDTLRIVFDKNEYICNGISALDGLMTVFGNASSMDAGEDTGEPFALAIMHNYQNVMIGTTSEGDTHTVAIYKQAETIHRIDPEYLPEGYPYKEVCETEVQLFQSPDNWVMESNGGSWPTDMTALGIPKEGDVCRVVFEGKEYTATAYLESTFEAPSGSYNNVIKLSGGENTGASSTDTQFIFTFVSAEKVIVELPSKGRYEEVGEVCVYGPGLSETIHPMAPEFLPAGVGGPCVLYANRSSGDKKVYLDANGENPVTKAQLFEIAERSTIAICDVGYDYLFTVSLCNFSGEPAELHALMVDSTDNVTGYVYYTAEYAGGGAS